MKRMLLVAGFELITSTVFAQHYNKYCNSVYSFCVDIPGNFSLKGDSKIGNGQYFTSKDGATLSAYGIFNESGETLERRFERE